MQISILSFLAQCTFPNKSNQKHTSASCKKKIFQVMLESSSPVVGKLSQKKYLFPSPWLTSYQTYENFHVHKICFEDDTRC
jgi:hypothetical protein